MRSPKYRWWTVGVWREATQMTVKLGPVTVCRYLWLNDSQCWFIGVLGRWTLLDTYRRRV